MRLVAACCLRVWPWLWLLLARGALVGRCCACGCRHVTLWTPYPAATVAAAVLPRPPQPASHATAEPTCFLRLAVLQPAGHCQAAGRGGHRDARRLQDLRPDGPPDQAVPQRAARRRRGRRRGGSGAAGGAACRRWGRLSGPVQRQQRRGAAQVCGSFGLCVLRPQGIDL